jgi:thiamine-monophosphate kinase
LDKWKVEKPRAHGVAGRLGERRIIEIMREHFDVMPHMLVPFGDDVSAVPVVDGEVAVLKTDMLVDKTDVPRGMSFWQAARKAVVMNISDFAAKGVEPKAVMVSLGLPRNLMQRDLVEIAKGLNAGARQYGAYIVGGDTGEASDLVISVHLFGTAKKDTMMLRSGAKVGDVMAVTDFFGKSAAGLLLLLNRFSVSDGLRSVLVESVFMPQARLKEGLALRRSGAITASIDSSDGLAWSLHELSKLSNVGFVITGLPVADEVKCFAEFNSLDVDELTLYGGEEYELVVAVNPKKWSEAETAIEAVGGRLLPIGKATRDKQLILDIDGKKRVIQPRGWEHFKSNY